MLAASRKSQHQVRLDESQGQVEVGRYEALVDVNGRPVGRFPQPGMFREFARAVIKYPVAPSDLLPANFTHLLLAGRSVKAGGDKNGDTLARNPGGLEPRQTGGRTSRLGAGRVMSHTEIAAERLPRASSTSGGQPTGLSSACAKLAGLQPAARLERASSTR